MARALRDAGKSVEVIKDAEGIHGLPDEEARRTFYSNLAAFLLKNVPPDPAP
jgi:dipeptidyl aminopeptidase/acylaminoacyl peptidase